MQLIFTLEIKTRNQQFSEKIYSIFQLLKRQVSTPARMGKYIGMSGIFLKKMRM